MVVQSTTRAGVQAAVTYSHSVVLASAASPSRGRTMYTVDVVSRGRQEAPAAAPNEGGSCCVDGHEPYEGVRWVGRIDVSLPPLVLRGSRFDAEHFNPSDSALLQVGCDRERLRAGVPDRWSRLCWRFVSSSSSHVARPMQLVALETAVLFVCSPSHRVVVVSGCRQFAPNHQGFTAFRSGLDANALFI